MNTWRESDQLGVERRVLEFLGEFSRTQSGIDTALSMYVERQMPNLGPQIVKAHLSRIRDENRIKFLIGLAKDVGYQGDLSNASRIYDRAKETRDLIGHSPGVGVVWHQHQLVVMVAREAGYNPQRLKKVPDPLRPETFDRLQNDCAWLGQHVWRLAYEAKLTHFVDVSGQPAEPPAPAEFPIDGEPLLP
jgi:hypothetical protein